MDRRTFLKVGGGGFAAAAVGRGWGPSPIVLRSASLELRLDSETGLPSEYRLLRANARFHGDDPRNRVAATVCDVSRRRFLEAAATVSSVESAASRADFHFTVADGQARAATFTLRYTVSDATVVVTLREVQESPGYELIDVALPRLVTVGEEDGPAWLAHGDGGGSLALLHEATPGSLAPNTFWGQVSATLPVVMVGTERALCVQEVTSFMDGTELQVAGDPGHRRASLGSIKVHRVNGSLCYDMNTGSGTPRNCGNARTPNLPVEQESSCRLDFLAAGDGNAHITWLDGAQLVGRRTPTIPTHLYDDAFQYGILCDQPGFQTPSATFAQCAELIRRVAALTDRAPQIVHLWGWQYRGKDTGYPAVAEVNPRIGGYEGMMRLMQGARDLNCRVTLSDNYDDAYRSSPAWDPSLVARRPDGELWESRNWTGENSYILGLAKYMRGPGMERVRYTCERYRLPGTTHIDVLSYFPIRNDWDPAQPASGIKNLREGRYAILEEYAKRGVDVSSEALRYAFVGKVSSFWNGPAGAPCPFGGKPIPLVPAVYNQSAVWGQGGRSANFAERLLKMFFYNGPAHTFFRADTDLRTVTDLFYLMMVPWFRLHARPVESFRREGERTIIGLAGNSQIDLDWGAQTYSATADGVEIAHDGSTFCPLGDDRLAFYSSTARELVADVPAGWEPAAMRALTLTGDGPREAPVAIAGGKVNVAAQAQQPVVVYRR